MSIEVDCWLKENAELLGIQAEKVGPHSVDICLGGHIIEFDCRGEKLMEIRFFGGESFTFQPGHF